MYRCSYSDRYNICCCLVRPPHWVCFHVLWPCQMRCLDTRCLDKLIVGYWWLYVDVHAHVKYKLMFSLTLAWHWTDEAQHVISTNCSLTLFNMARLRLSYQRRGHSTGPNAQPRQTSRLIEPLRCSGKLQEEEPVYVTHRNERIQWKSIVSKNTLSGKH